MSFYTSSIDCRNSLDNTPPTNKRETKALEKKTSRASASSFVSSPEGYNSKKFKISTPVPSLPLPYTAGFSHWARPVEEVKSMQAGSPQTPRKAVPSHSRFKMLHDSLQAGLFKDKKVCECARGSYSAVYEVQDSPDLVLKAYHGNIGVGFAEAALVKFMKKSLQNYKDIVTLNLPVAELINSETAIADGFILQKKIPHELDIQNPQHVEQASQFFSRSVKEQVAMDLQPQNLRVTDDNSVVLIDFIEEKDPVHVFIAKACKAWTDVARQKGFSKEAGHNLLSTLTADFLGSHSLFTSAWLAEIVGD